MSAKNTFLILAIITIFLTFKSFSNEKYSPYQDVDTYRGLRAGVSSFDDALRILGKPTTSISSNKNQITFKDNMYFYYKNLDLKLYGQISENTQTRSLKTAKISKIMHRK